jgi:hypothetical protein
MLNLAGESEAVVVDLKFARDKKFKHPRDIRTALFLTRTTTLATGTFISYLSSK